MTERDQVPQPTDVLSHLCHVEYYITKILLMLYEILILSTLPLFSHKVTDLILAILALFAAGLGSSVWQAAAGRRRLSVSVPLFVSKPGEGHTGWDGGH